MRVLNSETVIQQMHDARARTLLLIDELDAQQMMGPKMPIINPLLWEIAHASYFYEYWVLRQHYGHEPIRTDVDQLFDSINIAHDERWSLSLPVLEETLNYMQQVLDAVEKALESEPDERAVYLAQYAVFHEDMHTEAFTYTRQTLAYPAPAITQMLVEDYQPAPCAGDVKIPGGIFQLGAEKNSGFVFDNEKWAHPLEVQAFSISSTAVSNAEFLAFVEAGGYSDHGYWCSGGRQWLDTTGLKFPVYWRYANNWQQRSFDQWRALPMESAVIHVNWYEAQAYCRWSNRRLPTELEWEVAASAQPDNSGGLSQKKRYFPWGENEPTTRHANLDGLALGTVDVNAMVAGDSAFGCRQMIGNVWEWTDSDFLPYSEFIPDMYADYSQPLFGITKVLRGGAWPTRARMIRNSWRTYYGPERNDVFAGFRTCSL